MQSGAQSFYRYFPVSDRDKRWGLYVTTIGESRIVPHTSYPPPGHPKGYNFDWAHGRVLHEFALVYISSGRGSFESGRRPVRPIEPGDVFLLFPGVWHRYTPDTETGWREHWIGFDGEIARRWMARPFFSPNRPVIRTRDEDVLLTLFGNLMEAVRADRPALQQVLGGAAGDMLGRLFSAQQAGLAGGDRSQMAVEKAIARMRSALDTPLDMEALARDLGVSYSWFRSTFARHTGLSPHRYLLELRLGRARSLLAETRLSVKEVAAQIGLEDEHYFSRLFRRKLGVTPSAWRARTRTSPVK